MRDYTYRQVGYLTFLGSPTSLSTGPKIQQSREYRTVTMCSYGGFLVPLHHAAGVVNWLACEQALCLGKKIARKGNSPLDQRPVHRLLIGQGKLSYLRHFSVKFFWQTPFEAGGTAFIMNSKIHLRKISSIAYLRAFLQFADCTS